MIAAVMASVLCSILFSLLNWNMIAILSGQDGLCPPLPCNDQYTGMLQPSSELFNMTLIHQMPPRRVYIMRLRCVCTSPGSLLIVVLLFRAGVESNPGPCYQPPTSALKLGSLNICSAVNKTGNIHDTINEFRLDCMRRKSTKTTCRR